MRQKQNLIGKQFGKLTVISEAPKRKNDPSPYWNCQCECGKTSVVRTQNLNKGITKSCGELIHRTGENHFRWTGCGEMSGRYVCDLKKHAKQRGLKFTVTKKFLWNQFIKQSRCCALTGRPLIFCSGTKKYDTTASLDRIDSSKGYIKGNIQWVHKDINWFKRDYIQSEFIKMCKEVANYNGTPEAIANVKYQLGIKE